MTMGVKPFEAINNSPQMKLGCNSLFTHPYFANYTSIFVFLADFSPKHLETLRISRRWVLIILKWSNEGRMLTNNGARTKLEYDSRPWIFFINGFFFFLKINGSGMEMEE